MKRIRAWRDGIALARRGGKTRSTKKSRAARINVAKARAVWAAKIATLKLIPAKLTCAKENVERSLAELKPPAP